MWARFFGLSGARHLHGSVDFNSERYDGTCVCVCVCGCGSGFIFIFCSRKDAVDLTDGRTQRVDRVRAVLYCGDAIDVRYGYRDNRYINETYNAYTHTCIYNIYMFC